VKNNLGTNVTQIVQYHFQRLPWVNLWDQRFSKKFKINDRQSLEGDIDLFNTLNVNTVSGVSTSGSITTVSAIATSNFSKTPSGTYVPKPTDVISPRIFQLSLKYRF